MEICPQPAGTPTTASRSLTLIRRIFGPMWLRGGLTVLLEVPGRHSGTPRRVALFPIEVDGTSYLLSQYGDTDWVHNLRAADQGLMSRKGHATTITAIEVDGAERDRVIAVFRAKTPRPFRRDFDQRPAAADHPTFRVQPIG